MGESWASPEDDRGTNGLQEELGRLRAQEVLVAQAPSLANGAALAEGPAGRAFGPGERDMGEQNGPGGPCRAFRIRAWETVPDGAGQCPRSKADKIERKRKRNREGKRGRHGLRLR